SQTEQLKNNGSAALTISGATLAGGTQFKMCNWSYPVTLAAGQQANCPLSFSAASAGSFTGSVTFSTSTGSKVSVPMTATGITSSRTLSSLTSTLNFGNVTIGKTETLSAQLENTGNASLTVSGISVPAADLKTSGGGSGATIAPGQKGTLNVTFMPTKTEKLSGAVTGTRKAANSPTKITVAGTGVAAGAYSVSLSWTGSTSSGVMGYNVYRALQPGTSYSKLNASPVAGTSYVDSTVAAGKSYTYHVTAVNSQGEE